MMAYATNEFFQSSAGLGSGLRVFPTVIQPKTFESGSGVLAKLTPLTFDNATRKWKLWAGGVSEINVITAAAIVGTDGTFDLTINGITIADIDHDVSISALDTLITAALGLAAADLVVTEGGGGLDANDGTCTLTWAAEMGEQDIDISGDFTGITGDDHVLSTSQAGSSDRIDGFVWPDAVTLDAADEVLAQVFMAGRLHVDDIPIVSGYTLGALKAALRVTQVRDSGFVIEGLSQFH